MADFTSYREKCAAYGKAASDAEGAEKYEEAYDHYMKAIDIFMHMMKCKCLKIMNSDR